MHAPGLSHLCEPQGYRPRCRFFDAVKRPFYYARQYWFGHLEGAGVDWEPTLPHFQSLADAMEVAYGCLERYANEPKLTKEEAVALITCLRDTADFVIRRINQGNFSTGLEKWSADSGCLPYREAPNDLQELEECARNLDIARGNFQIKMALNSASDIRNKICEFSGDILVI